MIKKLLIAFVFSKTSTIFATSYRKRHNDGTVAQWINAPGYGPGDWGFESLRYHKGLTQKC